MFRIHWRVVASAVFVALLGATASKAGCDPAERELRFSITTNLTGHPKGEAAAHLARRINEDFEGRYCMTVHANASLMDDDTVLEAMLNGDVEFAAPSLSKFGKYTKQLQLFDLPFLFEDGVAAWMFQESPAGQQLKASMEDHGIIGLQFWNNGMKQLSANRILHAPKDAAGLRFRIQPSAVIQAQIEALGAKSVPMAFSKVQSALETGLVDGQENTWSNIYGRYFYRYQAATVHTDHAYLGYLVVTSRTFLDSLPEADRAQMQRLIEEVSYEANVLAYQINEARMQDVVADGGTVLFLSPAQRAEWKAAFAPVWDQFRAEIGEDLISAAQEQF